MRKICAVLRPLSTSCAEQAGMDCGKAATDVMSRPESCSHQGGALRAAGVAPEVARTVAHLPHVMPILVNAVGWENSEDRQQPADGFQRH